MEIWLVVGREMSKNQLKHVYLLSNNGQRKVMTVNQLSTFSNKNKVVNVKAYGGQLQGVGISLLSIPTYKKDAMGQMVQVSGASEQYVINAAQPYINKLLQDEQRKEAKKNEPDADKENKINYIINKLQLCFNILNELENTKTLTNEKLLIESVSRYTKQLDIDNADDSIENMVQRYGITGLVKSVDCRIDKSKERAKKHNLLKVDISQKTGFDTIQSLCEMLYQKVENIKKQHKITYDIIKEGKIKEDKIDKSNTEKLVYGLDDADANQIEITSEMEVVDEEFGQFEYFGDTYKKGMTNLDALLKEFEEEKRQKEEESRKREEERREREREEKYRQWKEEEHRQREERRKREERQRQREEESRQREEKYRQWEEERRQREEKRQRDAEAYVQAEIAKREAKLNKWLQEEDAKREEIITNSQNEEKVARIKAGKEAIQKGLNGPDGQRYKYIMYYLLDIEKKSGHQLKVRYMLPKEDKLTELVAEKLYEEDKQKGVNLSLMMRAFEIYSPDGEYYRKARGVINKVRNDILLSRGVDAYGIIDRFERAYEAAYEK